MQRALEALVTEDDAQGTLQKTLKAVEDAAQTPAAKEHAGSYKGRWQLQSC